MEAWRADSCHLGRIDLVTVGQTSSDAAVSPEPTTEGRLRPADLTDLGLLMEGCGMALRAPGGQMPGDATTAMPWHRRGAATPQMAPRRRNPKGGRHFAGAGRIVTSRLVCLPSGRRRMQSVGLDTRILFSAPC